MAKTDLWEAIMVNCTFAWKPPQQEGGGVYVYLRGFLGGSGPNKGLAGSIPRRMLPIDACVGLMPSAEGYPYLVLLVGNQYKTLSIPHLMSTFPTVSSIVGAVGRGVDHDLVWFGRVRASENGPSLRAYFPVGTFRAIPTEAVPGHAYTKSGEAVVLIPISESKLTTAIRRTVDEFAASMRKGSVSDGA